MYFTPRDEPYMRYTDEFRVSPKEEYDSNKQDIVWQGHYQEYVITIVQKNHNADIEEENITYQLRDDATKDDTRSVYFPKKEIAKIFNQYIDDAFR